MINNGKYDVFSTVYQSWTVCELIQNVEMPRCLEHCSLLYNIGTWHKHHQTLTCSSLFGTHKNAAFLFILSEPVRNEVTFLRTHLHIFAKVNTMVFLYQAEKANETLVKRQPVLLSLVLSDTETNATWIILGFGADYGLKSFEDTVKDSSLLLWIKWDHNENFRAQLH